MTPNLSENALIAMVEKAFEPGPEDHLLTVWTDLPDTRCPDTKAWQWRREEAARWARTLKTWGLGKGISVRLILYRNVRHANADLPAEGWTWEDDRLPQSADDAGTPDYVIQAGLAEGGILLALTEFSATAPLKVAARTLPIRGATLPGYTAAMASALALDAGEVRKRVKRLKGLLDMAALAEATFETRDRVQYRLELDLRGHKAHASDGHFPHPGTVGNLPGGEAYIVPNEGECADLPSRTAGMMPVQFGDELVIYRIVGNRAVEVLGKGPAALREAMRIHDEPAYSNLAELGLGVLADLGVAPIGEVLLDEKLGLHIAFGRSDHFGGSVGPTDFTAPDKVAHEDRVYVPACQPGIAVRFLDLMMPNGVRQTVIRDDRYVIDFEDQA